MRKHSLGYPQPYHPRQPAASATLAAGWRGYIICDPTKYITKTMTMHKTIFPISLITSSLSHVFSVWTSP